MGPLREIERIDEQGSVVRFENFRLGTSFEGGRPHAIWQVVLAMSCGAAQDDHAAGNVGGIRQYFLRVSTLCARFGCE